MMIANIKLRIPKTEWTLINLILIKVNKLIHVIPIK